MGRAKKIKSPTQLELVEPVFSILVELGRSATNDEIRDSVIKRLRLPDDVVDEPHKGDASQQTELEYQLAWARTRLKNLGAIINSQRGVWMITKELYHIPFPVASTREDPALVIPLRISHATTQGQAKKMLFCLKVL